MSIVKNSLRKFRVFIGRILGDTLKKSIKDFFYAFRYRVVVPLSHWFLIRRLRRKDKINVVFIASTLPMWRYQGIYDQMSKHPRFKTYILILPFHEYASEVQDRDVNTLRAFFDSVGFEYYIAGENMEFDLRKDLNPDILFYPQPYPGAYTSRYTYEKFRDKLLCYFPYAFWTAGGGWSYNEPLHNYAWKCFYSTEFHRRDASNIAYNKGCNVEVVGYPNADCFLFKARKDVWKPQSIHKKRIIWAPHFTIESDRVFASSNFLWMADFMLDLAEQYSDKIQFAFKPHPRLISHLYKHPDWGREKTEDYYNRWSSRENTQLEAGDFVDLFMASDAMIHDCGSFSVEYHYSQNPVLFVSDNLDKLLIDKNDFGKLAMSQHYIGKCKEDIIRFIEDVVLMGKDPMKSSREEFYMSYLLPPNGKSVAENTMNVFLKAFC